ncbi:hypothetical protein AB9P05_14170 [Roseivirga sp. BDSF3-8]|uniref:hypothetical protein n=1 Tax=Roseivirga sp. BDSF3-8 TaxID=3241598 RepID=UPI003531A7AA
MRVRSELFTCWITSGSGRLVLTNDLSHPPVDNSLSCDTDSGAVIPQALIALNIEETPGKSMNCMFYMLDEEDLATMDNTEKGYERFDVSGSIGEFDVQGGPVYAYRARDAYHKTPVRGKPMINMVPRLYLQFFFDAFAQLGEAYEKEFRESTEHYPEDLVMECEITKPE